MSDPGLLTIDPSVGGFERWLFIHNADHNRLTANANLHVTQPLIFRILDPLGADFDQWLLDHQKSHDDLAALTGVVVADLQLVDFRDARQRDSWLQINQQEHAAFAAALGI